MEEKWYDWAYIPIRRKVDSSMPESTQVYEAKFLSTLSVILERPGGYLGQPSLDRLLDLMTGYIVAVFDLAGYRITFEQRFRQYLCQKYHLDTSGFSLDLYFSDGRDNESGFVAFSQEFRLFCQSETAIGSQ